MKEENLVKLSLEISKEVEKLIPISLKNCVSIDVLLEKNMLYSRSHMRDVFGATTGIGLTKYIARRTYTLIIEEIGKEKFNKLKQKEKVYNIHSFKYKCIKEFPCILDDVDTSKMQPHIDEKLLDSLMETQLEAKYINSMMNSVSKEITKGRYLIDVSKLNSKILIQDKDELIVDLDKSYFKKDNIVFNISAVVDLVLGNEGKSISLSSANVAISSISKLYREKYRSIASIYVCTNWCGTGWGIASFISRTSCAENRIESVELSGHDFIVFDEEKVWLNLDYYVDKN